MKLSTKTVDSFEQIRQRSEEADNWTGKHKHRLAGVQRQLAVCWCEGSYRKELIWEGNTGIEWAFRVPHSLTWGSLEMIIQLDIYAPALWHSYTFFSFLVAGVFMGSKVKSITISDKLCCTGRSLWLTVQPFQPPWLRSSWIPAVFILVSAQKERQAEEHLRWVAGAHHPHRMHPQISGLIRCFIFFSLAATSYRKRTQENRLDGENYSLEYYLNYSVKHCVPGEPLIFPSTSWGDFVCVLLRPLWLTSEWLCL